MSVDSIIGSGLSQSGGLPIDLSREDTNVQYNLFDRGKVTLRLSQLLIRWFGIADSFVPGHPENGKIYDAGKLILFDDDLGGLMFDEPYTNRLDGSMYFWDRNRHI